MLLKAVSCICIVAGQGFFVIAKKNYSRIVAFVVPKKVFIPKDLNIVDIEN